MIKLAPQQFNFRQHWLGRIWPLLKTPSVVAALNEIRQRYLDIADFKFQENSPFDPEYAREVLLLDQHPLSCG
jgi:hypothetical protein